MSKNSILVPKSWQIVTVVSQRCHVKRQCLIVVSFKSPRSAKFGLSLLQVRWQLPRLALRWFAVVLYFLVWEKGLKWASSTRTEFSRGGSYSPAKILVRGTKISRTTIPVTIPVPGSHILWRQYVTLWLHHGRNKRSGWSAFLAGPVFTVIFGTAHAQTVPPRGGGVVCPGPPV